MRHDYHGILVPRSQASNSLATYTPLNLLSHSLFQVLESPLAYFSSTSFYGLIRWRYTHHIYLHHIHPIVFTLLKYCTIFARFIIDAPSFIRLLTLTLFFASSMSLQPPPTHIDALSSYSIHFAFLACPIVDRSHTCTCICTSSYAR